MEYIFYILVVALVVGYLIDPKGFKTTGKRIVTIVRSNIESGVPVKQIEPSKEHDEWTQKFKEIENPPSAALKAMPAPNHKIVAHNYYRAYDGSAWPQWICKCGGKNHVIVHQYRSLETAQREARADGVRHVQSSNKADELMNQKGDFAF